METIKIEEEMGQEGCGYEYRYSRGCDHGHHGGHGINGSVSLQLEGFSDLQQTVGDVGGKILQSVGDAGGKILKSVGDAECAILREVGDTKAVLNENIGDAECSILKEVGDAECAILSEVGTAKAQIVDRMGTYAQDNFKNQSDIAQRNLIALNAVERDLQNRVLENRSILSREIVDRHERAVDIFTRDIGDVKNQLRWFEKDTAREFCEVKTQALQNTERILSQMAANKYDALKDELDETRACRHSDRYASNFALQNQDINYLKQMIGSVEQNQKFANKTVQFGTGNLAGTAQTANQG